MIKAEKEKIEVTYLGWQEAINEPAFLLVNDTSNNTTVTYDERLHVIIKQED